MPKKRFDWSGGWIDYPGKGIIKDTDVARHVLKHINLWDIFNVKKMVACALMSQNILMGVIDEPKGDWKYK